MATKMSKSDGSFITLFDIMFREELEGRLFYTLDFEEQMYFMKKREKMHWEGLSIWQKIVYFFPKFKVFRTYPFGFVINLHIKSSRYFLFDSPFRFPFLQK